MQIKEANLEFTKSMAMRPQTNYLVVHHIGGTNRDVDPEEIHSWHLANGWSGCGYHFLIQKDGTVWECRPRQYTGAHAEGFNSESIGINVAGDFVNFEPEKAQIDSLVELLAILCSAYDLEPTGDTIIGHRDLMSTACPGDNLYNKLPEVVERVRSTMGIA